MPTRLLALFTLIAGAALAQQPCIEPPPLYHDAIYDIDVVQLVTNECRGFGWCAPAVLDGEPPLAEYDVYVNGEVFLTVPATVPQPIAGDTESVGDWDNAIWVRGATNLVWITVRNTEGAESSRSSAVGVVWTLPRAPMNLRITRTDDGVAMELNNIPPDVRHLTFEVTQDLMDWSEAASLSLRGAWN